MANPAYRVFLSHSSQNKVFVRELYRRLTRDGVSCFFDAESIGWGTNWVRALERAVDECEFLVLVLSPDFCNSEWAQVERTSALADDPSGMKRKALPLMLRSCRHLPTFPCFLRQTQAIDISTNALFEENYPRICGALGGVVRDDGVSLDRTKLPPVHPLPQRHCMPFYPLGDKFVGRVEQFWHLYDSLFRDSTTVLQGAGVVAGAGGLGKSQLAIEYAHRFGPAYPGGVYWVAADQGFRSLVTDIGRAAGIAVDPKAEEPKQVEEIWHGLHALNAPCLVILDNFPEQEPLRPYLPPTGRIHTIITTRRQDLAHASVRLTALSPGDGVRLLNSGERLLGAGAAALAECLGGLPLALELAKSYLNFRQDLDVEALLAEIESAGEIDVLSEFAREYKDELPSRHERDVVRTIQLSWEIAPDAAKPILRVMGELSPAAVPRALLRSILGLPEQPGLIDPLNKALGELVRLSLVELDTAGDPVMHRLILAFMRRHNLAANASPAGACLEAIQQQMKLTFANPDARIIRQLEGLVPHAEFLLAQGRLNPEGFGDLANRLGNHHKTMGRFAAAKQAHTAALASAEQSLPTGHPSIAIRQSNLAMVLKDLGQLGEARDLLRQALASSEKSFAAGHPSIAIQQSNLAGVLQDLGQLEEAQDLLRQALASDERSFAAGHPKIAIGQSNLALVLKDLGQLEKARDLLRQALASDEQSFAAGHPTIAIRQSNLAVVLKDLGQLEEARDLLRQALASDEQSFAAGHPTIAIRQSNLAVVLKDLGQLEEARDLLRQALASDEQSFEAGHPSIASSQSNLGMVLKALVQPEEARTLLRQAYAASLERYGPDHPPTKLYKSNLESLPKSEDRGSE